MAKFLTTSATSCHLEELIKSTAQQLIIISPYLKSSDRMRELLEDKNRMKIDVRIVYGKSELAPTEINWLQTLEYVRTSFCKNLHAKCYLNERSAIITSMNLYHFSQVNNNEMGVFIDRDEDPDLYRDTSDEAQRLIRVSDEVRIKADKKGKAAPAGNEDAVDKSPSSPKYDKLTTSKLGKARGLSTSDLTEKLISCDLLVREEGMLKLTIKGEAAGGEFRFSKKTGPYFLWPTHIDL